MKKEASLSIIEDVPNHRFVMVRNHRGINAGCINFPGGKKEPNETMIDCVKRETLEETGLTIEDPVQVGYVEFPTMEFYVTVFKSTKFSGDMKSDKAEVDVFWQDADKIPFDQMREADKDFIPLILKGQYVKKRYMYDKDFKIEKIIDLSEEE